MFISLLPSWARVATVVVGVIGGQTAHRFRGHTGHASNRGHAPTWSSPVSAENACYAADSPFFTPFLNQSRDFYFCSYPVADADAQCELVPDYYGADHLWLCSFERPTEAIPTDTEHDLADDSEGHEGMHIPLF